MVTDFKGVAEIRNPRLRSLILDEIAARSMGEKPDDLVAVMEEVARDLRLQ